MASADLEEPHFQLLMEIVGAIWARLLVRRCCARFDVLDQFGRRITAILALRMRNCT